MSRRRRKRLRPKAIPRATRVEARSIDATSRRCWHGGPWRRRSAGKGSTRTREGCSESERRPQFQGTLELQGALEVAKCLRPGDAGGHPAGGASVEVSLLE